MNFTESQLSITAYSFCQKWIPSHHIIIHVLGLQKHKCKKKCTASFSVLIFPWPFLLGTNNWGMEEGFRWDQRVAPALLPGQGDWECKKHCISFFLTWKEATLCLETFWSTHPIVGRKVFTEDAEPHLLCTTGTQEVQCPRHMGKEGSKENGLERGVRFGGTQWSPSQVDWPSLTLSYPREQNGAWREESFPSALARRQKFSGILLFCGLTEDMGQEETWIPLNPVLSSL